MDNLNAAFTARQPSKDLDYAVLGMLERLEQGQISEMTISQQGKGVMVYVQEKRIPDLSEANPQYAVARQQLAQVGAMLDQGSYLAEVVEGELKKSAPGEAR